MRAPVPIPAAGGPGEFISTGSLPPPEQVQAWVDEAHARHRLVTDGAVSRVYPALTVVAPELFGIAVAGVNGQCYTTGDAAVEFTIMSVAKPFVFALACQQLGVAAVHARVGVNATGLPFNSLAAVEQATDGRTNPMVNAGALATAGLVPGRDVEQRWQLVLDTLSRFAGRPLVARPRAAPVGRGDQLPQSGPRGVPARPETCSTPTRTRRSRSTPGRAASP